MKTLGTQWNVITDRFSYTMGNVRHNQMTNTLLKWRTLPPLDMT